MYIFSHNLDLRKNASFVGARKLFVREQNKTSAKIRRVRNLMGLRYLIFFSEQCPLLGNNNNSTGASSRTFSPFLTKN